MTSEWFFFSFGFGEGVLSLLVMLSAVAKAVTARDVVMAPQSVHELEHGPAMELMSDGGPTRLESVKMRQSLRNAMVEATKTFRPDTLTNVRYLSLYCSARSDISIIESAVSSCIRGEVLRLRRTSYHKCFR